MSMVVIGAVFVDVKGFPSHKYIPAGRNEGRVETVHGGVGRNVAEDLGNIGLTPCFLTIVDESAQGQEVLDRLEKQGVDTRYILHRNDGMGMWLAVFDHTGDIVASISKRPDMSPLARLLQEKGDEIFAHAESVSLEIDIEEEVVEQVLRLARKYHTKVYAVVSNISIAMERRHYFRYVDCFVCNRQEAEMFFGEAMEELTMAELRDSAERLRVRDGLRSLVVTSGGQGSVYCAADGEKGVHPAEPVMVKDTTGAGDAFFAGVVAGLSCGRTLSEAVDVGTRLASMVIARMENVCPHMESKADLLK